MKTSAMTVTTLQLFQILKEKLGEHQAETLITYVDTRVHNEFEEHKEHLATKEDIAILRGDFDAKFTKLDTKMTTLIWMFGILITAIGFSIGVILKFVK